MYSEAERIPPNRLSLAKQPSRCNCLGSTEYWYTVSSCLGPDVPFVLSMFLTSQTNTYAKCQPVFLTAEQPTYQPKCTVGTL